MKSILVGFTLAAVACAQPALVPPQFGFLEDGANSFRPVFGVAGNFALGGAAFSGITNAAYSGSFGLIKTDSAVMAVDNQARVLTSMDAPSGPAAFAFFSDGSPAFVYLPGANLLFMWYGTAFQMVPFDCRLFLPSAVLGISAPDRGHVAFLVERNRGLHEIRLLVESGQPDSQIYLGRASGPAFRLSSGELVFADATGLVIRNADASEIHLNASLPSSFTLAQIGTGWVELSDAASSARIAIRVSRGHEGLYFLPGVNQ